MSKKICHDFKTPRTDMSRRLPGSMRAIPVIFYLVTAFGTFAMFKAYHDHKQASTELQAAADEKEMHGMAKATLDIERSRLDVERIRGEAVAKWVEGTRSLQPISVAIARSMPVESFITELNLQRQIEIPAQIELTLRMANASPIEVSKVEQNIQKLRYRSHSPQQNKQGDILEFRSMLVWQDL
jgi:hypothetical protein